MTPGAPLDLPTSHRIPITWLSQHAGEVIRYRTMKELAPAGAFDGPALDAARTAAMDGKLAQAVVKKQKDDGIWGHNLLGLAASARDGIKDVGTVPQYRRLLELAYPRDTRPFKLADRVLFRLLTRDDDPALLFEYQKLARMAPEVVAWARETGREAATSALAEAGLTEDPRVRGAGHRIASAVSAFLRSPLAEKPFVRAGSSYVLHPEAYPPSWYSVAMLAAMPALQRERAGFTERLGHYLAQPAPKKAYAVKLGKKNVKPAHLLLGDPITADARGNTPDIPLALYYIELMARMGALAWAPVATRVLARLLSECDASGVWRPKVLRTAPKAGNRITWHVYPLIADTKGPESRSADVTFRLAIIARTLGWDLSYS